MMNPYCFPQNCYDIYNIQYFSAANMMNRDTVQIFKNDIPKVVEASVRKQKQRGVGNVFL